MPFTIAHAAAIIPLRRLCPKYLSLSALIFGSLIPDIAYLLYYFNSFSHTAVIFLGNSAHWLTRWGPDWDDFSHTLAGSFGFCLPAGALALAVFFQIRQQLVEMLPNPHRDVLLPLCRTRGGSKLTILCSLLIGSWLHIGLDLLTNGNRWLAQNWTFLNSRIAHIGPSGINVHRALWLIGSIAGMIILVVEYFALLNRAKVRFWDFGPGEIRRYMLWCAILVSSACAAIPAAFHFARFGTSAHELFNFSHHFAQWFLVVFGGLVTSLGLFVKFKECRLIAMEPIIFRRIWRRVVSSICQNQGQGQGRN